MLLVQFILYLVICICFNDATDTPIIGILSQETYSVRKYLNEDGQLTGSSFIAASYVKFLESGGARVIPVWIGQNEEYYERVVNYTNGLLFPGGATYFNETAGYGEAATIIYKLAERANNNGTYYPLWGTCLGMQVLMYAVLGEDFRADCDSKNSAVPLNIENGSSKLLSKASTELLDILKTENVTYNYHRYCITESILKEHNLTTKWRIISTNLDKNNLQYISSMESTDYPFFAVQFHPEKNMFEYKNSGIPHSAESIVTSQYFANYFVDECRKNGNTFPDVDLENDALIYNFSPVYSGKSGSSYEQIYQFGSEDYKQHQLL